MAQRRNSFDEHIEVNAGEEEIFYTPNKVPLTVNVNPAIGTGSGCVYTISRSISDITAGDEAWEIWAKSTLSAPTSDGLSSPVMAIQIDCN